MEDTKKLGDDIFDEILFIKKVVYWLHFTKDPGDLERIELAALEILAELEGLHIAELGEHLKLSRPQSTVLVKRLEELSLVTRASDPTDARISRISIAKLGRKKLDAHLASRRIELDEKLSPLSLEEKRELCESMGTVIQIVRKLNLVKE